MRISDWSSDVCSSDLRPGAVRRRAGAGARAVRGGRPRSRPGPGASGLGRAGPFDLDQLPVDAPAGVLDRVADRAQLFQRRAIAMLLQTKALEQHFLPGLAHGGVVAVGAGPYFGPGSEGWGYGEARVETCEIRG